MLVSLLKLQIGLGLGYVCKTGYYLEENECVSCERQSSNCAGCTSEACLECEEGYFLEAGKCTNGYLLSECSPYSSSFSCDQCKETPEVDAFCAICDKNEEFCEKCQSTCLSCTSVLEIQSPIEVRVISPLFTKSSAVYAANFIKFTSFKLRCAERMLFEKEFTLDLKEYQELISMEIPLEVPEDTVEGSLVQIVFQKYGIEIDTVFSRTTPSSYACSSYNSVSKSWEAGCSIFEIVWDNTVLDRNMLKTDIQMCENSLLVGLILFPLLFIFALLVAFRPKKPGNELSAEDEAIKAYQIVGDSIRCDAEVQINTEEINEIYEKAAEFPNEIVVIQYENSEDGNTCNSDIKEEGFLDKFANNHLVLGQLRPYYYDMMQRNVLFVLNGVLIFLGTEILIKMYGFPQSEIDLLVYVCDSSLYTLSVLSIIEIALFLSSKHQFLKSFIEVLVMIFLFCAVLGTFYMSHSQCNSFGINWIFVGVLAIGFDWIVTQSAVSTLKAIIIS